MISWVVDSEATSPWLRDGAAKDWVPEVVEVCNSGLCKEVASWMRLLDEGAEDSS